LSFNWKKSFGGKEKTENVKTSIAALGQKFSTFFLNPEF
jgi:isocitrate lyase